MVAATLATLLFATQPIPDRRVLLPFDYRGVRVTDGILKRQMDDAKDYYLRIPNDDLLLGFRRRAGLPAPGRELGGWYGEDTFHIFGQILSGLSRLYAATGDPACKAKAAALYEGWAKTIGPDGYFYYSKKPNAPPYIYDKMVGGLVDFAIYCDRPDSYKNLKRITDWAVKNLDRSRPWLDGREWYTLSENLYRAFAATGNPEYRDFAKVWEYTTYWSAFAQRRDIFAKQPDGNQTNRYHAYSHVNTLGGAAWAYRIGGEPHYLDTIRNAYDYLQSNEVMATGGFGPDESLVPNANLGKLLESTTTTFETQCGSWAIFKLCKNLIALTGDAKYGDWVEQAAYNGIAATIPMSSDGGVFYYSDYNPFGGTKVNQRTLWTCCAGTRPMAAADVDDLIYFRSPNGLDVNLFVPSTVSFDHEAVRVIQSTRFPDAASTQFEIHINKPTALTIRLRHPSWLRGEPGATINGKRVRLSDESGHWMALRRTWKDGDVLSVELPMELHSVPLYADKTYPTALAVGPVVLASRSDSGSPVDKIDLKDLSHELTPETGEPLNYHLRQDPSVLVRPFYEYKEGEEYFMYLDPIALSNVPGWKMKRSGHWNGGDTPYSNDPNAWIEGSFEGDSVKILAHAFEDAGQASVSIDGKLVATIDQYGPGRDLPWEWKTSGLGPGRHTLRITVLGKKATASKDRYINVLRLEATAK